MSKTKGVRMSGRTALQMADDINSIGPSPVADMLRQQHAEIERLTSELEACADSCESEADKSAGWAKVRMIEMANRMRRGVGERGKP